MAWKIHKKGTRLTKGETVELVKEWAESNKRWAERNKHQGGWDQVAEWSSEEIAEKIGRTRSLDGAIKRLNSHFDMDLTG